MLQVQVLYSDADQENSNPTPGWSVTAESKKMQKGGRSIKLDVSCSCVRVITAPPVVIARVGAFVGKRRAKIGRDKASLFFHPLEYTGGTRHRPIC